MDSLEASRRVDSGSMWVRGSRSPAGPARVLQELGSRNKRKLHSLAHPSRFGSAISSGVAMPSSTTGAASGCDGGRISGGNRARTALRRAPRVRVVATPFHQQRTHALPEQPLGDILMHAASSSSPSPDLVGLMVQIAQQSSLHAMTSMLGHLSQNPQLLQQFSNSVASSSSSISAPSSRPTGNGKAKAKWGKGKAKMAITPSPLVLTQQPTLDTKKRGETVTVVTCAPDRPAVGC